MNAKLQHKMDRIEDYEHHPVAFSALIWIKDMPSRELKAWLELFDDSKDNSLADRCADSLRKILNDERVPDVELLGLAWTLRHILPAPA